MITVLASALLLQSPSQITAPLEAPFKVTEHAIIVDVFVNGKPASFMFDTGFGGWFIVSDQVNVGPKSGTTTLRDFVGQFQASTVEVRELQIGQLKQTAVRGEAVQQPVSHMTQSYGTHTDGIMGFAPIMDYVTEINFEKKKFIFHPRSVDITKRKADGVKTFLVKMEPRGMNSIELLSEVNGKPIYLALDTGNSFYTTTHKEVLERVGLWDPAKKPSFLTQSFVASGPVDSFSLWVPEAKIFGVPVKNSVWDVIDLPSSSAEDDGTVGFGFLKNFNIVIDFERRYVWLDNFTGKVANDPVAEPGIRVAAKEGGGFWIYSVYKGSPAEEKGIKVRDTLLSVDGKALSTVTPNAVRTLLEGAADSICKLVISRDGIIQRVEVPRKLMVNGAPK